MLMERYALIIARVQNCPVTTTLVSHKDCHEVSHGVGLGVSHRFDHEVGHKVSVH